MLRNDCLLVIYAREKGSNSPQLQAAAEAVCREALEAGVKKVLYMHVPGEQLNAEGIDGGSREGALRLAGPVCTSETRRQVKELLALHGWRIEYGMGSRKYMVRNRWKRARKGLRQQGALGQLRGILN